CAAVVRASLPGAAEEHHTETQRERQEHREPLGLFFPFPLCLCVSPPAAA
ncbi:MAG: hypothetical protein AVDCRST_MAG89-949, partial [uncultured Gemmatimonadetes bacterium]